MIPRTLSYLLALGCIACAGTSPARNGVARDSSVIAPPPVAPVVPPASATVVRPSELASAIVVRRDSLIARGRRLSPDEVGYYMDVHEARFRQIASNWLRVSRSEDRVVLSLPGALSFDPGSSALSAGAREGLGAVARVLVEYRQTVVTLQGHTDSIGDVATNQRISEQRALAVARLLSANGVGAERIIVTGYGSSAPAAPNETEAGRETNRRVVIEVIPLYVRSGISRRP